MGRWPLSHHRTLARGARWAVDKETPSHFSQGAVPKQATPHATDWEKDT